MELVADDRERHVIKYLEPLIPTTVKRITVGDYAYIYKGKVIVTVERKTLADLAASIKDGRMENNNKLLECRATTNCHILYIIEGPAYPHMERKFGRIPYKCLQGKLDSLMFRHDIKIIWTRDAAHTASRLAGLYKTYATMMKRAEKVAPVKAGADDPTAKKDTPVKAPAGAPTDAMAVINKKHEVSINMVHVNMLKTIKGVTFRTAALILEKFSIHKIILGQMDVGVLCAMQYPSGNILGNQGLKIAASCKALCGKAKGAPKAQARIISSIKGVTLQSAADILERVPFVNIVCSKFDPGGISNIKRSTGMYPRKRLGLLLERRIRETFKQGDANLDSIMASIKQLKYDQPAPTPEEKDEARRRHANAVDKRAVVKQGPVPEPLGAPQEECKNAPDDTKTPEPQAATQEGRDHHVIEILEPP
jgi:ERCC4-type nuclease